MRRLNLWEQRNQRCEGFSRGMRQKTVLAGALIHAPRLLMLDEPLTGLDAGAARQVKDILAEQTRAGVAVVLTTHILEVAEKLADRIGIIAEGKLIAEGDLNHLKTLGAAQAASLEEVFLDLTAAAQRGRRVSLSLPRLLRHDLRLSWRRMCAFLRAKTDVQGVLVIAAIVAVLHLVGWWFATSLTQWAQDGQMIHLTAMGVVIILPWLFSQGLTGATRALYSRGDLDLLFASPLPPSKILTSRALAVAIESFGSVGIFLLPIAVDAALQGQPAWLAVAPALAATALLTTGLALAATLGLFALLGPKRTRSVGQVLATLVGAWFVVCAQIFNFLPTDWRAALRAQMDHPAPGSLFDPNTALWLPARAAAGDGLALALWSLLGLVRVRRRRRPARPRFCARRLERGGGRAGFSGCAARAKISLRRGRGPCGARNGGCWRAIPISSRRCCCNRSTRCRSRW